MPEQRSNTEQHCWNSNSNLLNCNSGPESCGGGAAAPFPAPTDTGSPDLEASGNLLPLEPQETQSSILPGQAGDNCPDLDEAQLQTGRSAPRDPCWC